MKLTYEEYKKAQAAGMGYGSACCCLGPQDKDEYCPCSMRVLDLLTTDGQEKLKQDWTERGYYSRSVMEAHYAELEQDPIERNPLRKKRLELMAQKYPNIEVQKLEGNE